ncbi:hypothetical protein [Nocardioides plantarum]|uniref:Nucleotidyltransferase-like protein n=1 Tax=Nocardioides plantarum TaxID=29299 RepID=A0ABV5KH74_9ACTN|nr:hypothetical protein [Nocardioides plantarum]
MSTHDDHPAEYVAARRTLLDVLDALEDHRSSMILIGAQAVYMHAVPTTSMVPPMTTDADLALDADLLADDPEIATALSAAGFTVGQPGHWENVQGIAVDLMVAPHQANRPEGKRAADLAPHDKKVARVAPGLAAALTDNEPRDVGALVAGDDRVHVIRVAGPAALVVAKAIKIDDRLADAAAGKTGRIVDKDALDLLRLLQSIETQVLVEGLSVHPGGSAASAEVERAMGILTERAASAEADIPRLAAQAAGDDPTISASLAALVAELLQAWASGTIS